MPHAETYEFGPILFGNHADGRDPVIYVEYGPFVNDGYGTIVAAGEFISVITVLAMTPRGILPLRAIRGCCGAQPWEVLLQNEAKWDPNAEQVLEIGEHRFTEAGFHDLVAWLASVPFLNSEHIPYLRLDEGTLVRFKRLQQRLGIKVP